MRQISAVLDVAVKWGVVPSAVYSHMIEGWDRDANILGQLMSADKPAAVNEG